MIDLLMHIHYIVIALTIAIPAIGVSIGQGLASAYAIEVINQQPATKNSTRNLVLLGIALLETGAIIATILSIMLLLNKTVTTYDVISEIGIMLAIAIPSALVGIMSALPICKALEAHGRQPFAQQKIMNIMLISQSIMQTPIVFGFVVAFLTYLKLTNLDSAVAAYKLLASNAAVALGCIGPTIGLSMFAQTACSSIGKSPQAYPQLLSFTFISQAMIETPILFALVIALILNLIGTAPIETFTSSIAFLGSAFAVGMATLSTGIGSARIALQACKEIAQKPQNYSDYSRTSILGQTFIDTNAIYGFVIAIFLIFMRYI